MHICNIGKIIFFRSLSFFFTEVATGRGERNDRIGRSKGKGQAVDWSIDRSIDRVDWSIDQSIALKARLSALGLVVEVHPAITRARTTTQG